MTSLSTTAQQFHFVEFSSCLANRDHQLAALEVQVANQTISLLIVLFQQNIKYICGYNII